MIFLGAISAMEINATPVNSDTTEYIQIENAIYDELYVDSDVTAEYDTTIPEWGYTTILDAKFRNNILAGNVDFTLSSISNLLVKKRKQGDYKWTTIHNVPINSDGDFDFFYNDIVVASNTTYEYAAVPIIGGVEGTYQIVDVDVKFEGCFIIDPTYGYQVIGELHRDNLTRGIPSNIIETVHSPYPYVHYYSEIKYDKFTVSGLWAELNRDTCRFDMDNAWKYRKALRDFLSNRHSKIVKWYDGQIYMACVVDQVSETMNKPHQHVITSVPFVEVGNVESNHDLYYHGFIEYLEVGV